MTTLSLPPVSALPSLSAEERARILDLLFEPCVQLHTLSVSALKDGKFATYHAVTDHVRGQLKELLAQSELESNRKWLEVILSAHPRLGEKKVESEMSKKEQSGLQGQGQAAETETQKLKELNDIYEEKFPGLRYVTFVNNRPRSIIMEDMRDRIENSTVQKEKEDAINVWVTTSPAKRGHWMKYTSRETRPR